MKDFNDFIISIDTETAESIARDVNLKMEQARTKFDPSDPKFLGTQLTAAAYTISLELLGLYHKWLWQMPQDQQTSHEQ